MDVSTILSNSFPLWLNTFSWILYIFNSLQAYYQNLFHLTTKIYPLRLRLSFSSYKEICHMIMNILEFQCSMLKGLNGPDWILSQEVSKNTICSIWVNDKTKEWRIVNWTSSCTILYRLNKSKSTFWSKQNIRRQNWYVHVSLYFYILQRHYTKLCYVFDDCFRESVIFIIDIL
jgi:hypothetical protein